MVAKITHLINYGNCEILDFIQTCGDMWWHESGSWFDNASFTSLEQTTASHGRFFWTFYNCFFFQLQEGRLHTVLLAHCLHNSHVLRMPLNDGKARRACLSHMQDRLRNEKWGNSQRIFTGAKNTVLLEQRGERLQKAPHLPPAASRGFNTRTTISTGSRRGWISASSPALLDCRSAYCHLANFQCAQLKFMIRQNRNPTPQKCVIWTFWFAQQNNWCVWTVREYNSYGLNFVLNIEI